VVAVKMPVSVALLPRRLRVLRAEVDSWWRTATGPSPADPPLVRLAQAREMLRRSMRRHMLASLVAQGCYDQVAGLAAAAGLPGLELSLMTGYGGMEETRISADLWDVSRGRLALEEFLRRHGFHGPSEGQLASRPWREDRRAIEDICRTYRRMGDDEHPRARERRQIETRLEAERRLLAALPPAHRLAARITLRVAARYLPLREVGKASFLQSVDAGRAAARQIGDELLRAGRLAEREDVFFLTMDEITAEPAPDLAGRAGGRRLQHADYLELQLPERWVGTPEPVRRGAHGGQDRTGVTGVPVSPGVAEGRARVVDDPDDVAEFEPGDILVCETTDPSWVVLFQLAGAVVIDVGGAMSHGAIVARELGLPCVINTRTGTSVIADGDRIRVDGTAGRVDILPPGTGTSPSGTTQTSTPETSTIGTRSPHAS
jgi:pyruvate,water dikinase